MNQLLQQPAVATTSSSAAIPACFQDDKIARYAANKHRGGSSGKKGSRYEDVFIGYKVAEIASSRVGAPSDPWPSVAGQTEEFVDDALIRHQDRVQYFQLKNVQNITWTGGDHPLETDFSLQYRLACFQGHPSPTTTLVVPDQALQAKLQATMPAAISGYSDVQFFPYSDTINRLVLENSSLHAALGTLSRSRAPHIDELVGVLWVLTAAGNDFAGEVSVEQVLHAAARFVPNQLRTVGITVPVVLRTAFAEIVDRIAGLKYDVSQGFFSWDAFGTSGIFDFDCAAPQFEDFQKLIEQENPTTFERFEELLP